MLDFLTAPSIPRVSLSIDETHLALVELQRRRGAFGPRRLGVQSLPPDLVRAHFTEPNIADEAALAERLGATAEEAGLGRLRRLTVALPEGSTHSLVISLEHAPGSRAELQQMLEWKVERNTGCQFADLRVSHRRLSPFHGRVQWLAVATHREVIEQYERVLQGLGWQAGVVMPRHLGEAQWLMRGRGHEDRALVSFNEHGFAVVVVRGAEPIMLRSLQCAPEEREDEFYRLMVFYRDRLLPGESAITLNRLLTLGTPEEQRRYRQVLADALEAEPEMLTPPQLGLDLAPGAPFSQFAAAAGLATLAWNR